jgi:proline-serine-threonine phosphatase interacting protein 1
LRESWDQLKVETEASGKVHLGLAQKILDEIHHTVKEFREQQREIRKKVKDIYISNLAIQLAIIN